MKNVKILIIGIFLIISSNSCSKEDDTIDNNSINPPSWIIGSWLDKSEPTWAQIGGFKFTNVNLIELSAENTEILNYKESFKTGLMNISETSNTNSYSIKIESQGVTVIDYYFEKSSSSEIIYDLNSSYNVILTKQ